MRGDFMLLQFRAKNYRSIGDEIVLDMTAVNSLSDHKEFLIEKNGVNILPVAALFGANASGKSNVLKSISTMRENVDPNQIYEKQHLYTTPFLYDDKKRTEPTEFEVFFTSDDKEYRYGYICQDEQIIEEWLYKRKLSRNETKWKMIFEREYQNISYNASKKYSNLSEYNHLIGTNMLVLNFFYNKELKDIEDFYIVNNFFVDYIVFNNANPYNYRHFLNVYHINPELKNNAVKFLQEFDPSIENFIIKENEDKDGKKVYEAYTVHNKKEYPLDIESDGTQKLIFIYIYIYLALELGNIIIIDELDCQLHPLILRKIVQMFHDKTINKNNAQLIFSSHNLILLDKNQLRRDEIWFVEKNDKQYTDIFSLAEFKTDGKHIRSDTSYGKHYLSGCFGAIPFLSNKEE